MRTTGFPRGLLELFRVLSPSPHENSSFPVKACRQTLELLSSTEADEEHIALRFSSSDCAELPHEIRARWKRFCSYPLQVVMRPFTLDKTMTVEYIQSVCDIPDLPRDFK